MMPRAVRSFLLASVILAGAACDDKGVTAPPLTPIAESRSTAPLHSSTVVSAAQVLKRTVPVKSPFSARALIGPAGGTLAIPQTGVYVQFARGAVAVPTMITITAVEGSNV